MTEEKETDPYTKAKEVEQRLFNDKDIREILTYNKLFLGEFIRHNFALILRELLTEKQGNFFLSDLRFSLFWFSLRTRDRIFRFFRKSTLRFNPKTKSKEKKIVIIVNAITHVTTMVLVIEKLKEKGVGFLIIANSNGAQKKLAEYGLKHVAFGSYINSEIMKKVKKRKKFLKNKFEEIENKKSLEKITGLTLPWISIKNKFLSLIFWTIQEVEMLNYLIEEEKPSLIVVLNELEMFGRIVVGVAKSKEIPTLYIQHGAISRHPSYLPVFADKMATWGPQTKELLVELGSDHSRIEVTGCPAYDRLLNWKVNERIYQILNLDKDKGIVVLATQPSGFEVKKEHSIRVIRGVISAMKNFPDKQLVLKLHPDEYGFMHERIIREMNAKNVRICKHRLVSYKLNIFDVLKISDLLITQFSTTAIEAIILDKPVITINLTGKPDVMPYAKSGAAIGVYKEEDIEKVIDDALNNKKVRDKLAENRKKFVYDFNFKNDGKASERVVDLIENMIK